MTSTDYLPYIIAAAQALFEQKEEVNRLNVFPVPDGDTGTNMSLTFETVVQEVSALDPDASIAEVRKAITHGSLMGARGNSGVITSQILRGICEGVEQYDDNQGFDTAIIAEALNRAVEVAFGAVRKPVEGTILTVLRDCADAAQKAVEDGLGRNATLQAISEEAFASVRRTPDLLPVLKENNVVDAGGYGLAILIKGFVDAVTGSSATLPDVHSFMAPEPRVAIEGINDWEGSAFRYCTEFLLHSEGLDTEQTLAFLGGLGDCELLVGSHPDFKVHVHTNEPGQVLTYMTERGQVSEVHIHNMQIQTAQRDEALQNAASSAAGGNGSIEPGGLTGPASDSTNGQAPKDLGFVAVCAGSGTQNILESAGVDLVVRGGQTMNPSTKDFVDAIEQTNAERIFVFPNNKNVILAANAAADIVEKEIAVIPTTSVLQSFAALFAADLNQTFEQNIEIMNAAIEQVHSGEITTAIKNAKAANGKAIKKGDIIGLADGSIEVIGKNLKDVALNLVGIISENADVLTLLAGEDLEQDEFSSLVEAIEEAYPDLEIDAQRGEQPLYPLVMSAE